MHGEAQLQTPKEEFLGPEQHEAASKHTNHLDLRKVYRRNWWVLDMAGGYTTEGSVCRQVRHFSGSPQHGVQINRD